MSFRFQRLLGKASLHALVGGIVAVALVLFALVVLLPRGGGEDSPPAVVAEVVKEVVAPVEVVREVVTEVAPSDPEPTPTAEAVEVVDQPEATPAPPAPKRREGMLRVHGTVTSSTNGSPIAGARVMFPEESAFIIFQGKLAPHVETTSAQDGTWELHVEQAVYRPEGIPVMDGALISIFSSADGYAGNLYTRFIENLIGDEVRVDIELMTGDVIMGRVVNEAGSGVANARVGWTALGPMPREMESIFASAETRSGPDGFFELKGLPAGKTFGIPAQAEGYLPGYAPSVEVGDRNVVITLKVANGSIIGQVLEHDGSPAPGMKVLAMHQDEVSMQGEVFMIGTAIRETTSDSEGKFRFEGLGHGDYSLAATEPGVDYFMMMGSGSGKIASGMVSLEANEEASITLKFSGSTTVSGKVIDEKSGDGIAGVLVSPTHLSPGAARPEDAVVTGHDGRFEVPLRSLPNHWQSLYLRMPEGWVHVQENQWGTANQVQFISQENQPEIIIRATRGILVRGVVLASDGVTPVAGVRPRVSRMGSSDTNENPTDATGNFRFYTLPNHLCTVQVHAPAGFASQELQVGTEAPSPITLVLSDFASISGIIRDWEGNPVKGIGVSVMYPSHMEGGMTRTTRSLPNDATSNEKGYYFVDKVPPMAPEVVTVGILEHSLKGDYGAPPSLELSLKPGQYYREADFILGPQEALEGIVIDQDGNPIAGANIQVHSMGGGHFHRPGIVSDEHGEFYIPGVNANDSYYVSPSKAGYVFSWQGYRTLDESPITLRMNKAGVMTLRVMDGPGGGPVTHYLYKAGGPTGRFDGQPGEEVRNEKGTTTLRNFTPGTTVTVFVVEVLDGDRLGRRGQGQGTVPADGTGEIEIIVGNSLSISGRVITRDGTGAIAPVEGAEVSARPDVPHFHFFPHWGGHHPAWKIGAFSPPKAVSNSLGEFTLGGLEPGAFKVAARRNNPAGSGTIDVEVAEGRDKTGVEVELVSAARILGVIRDRNGEPMANVPLMMSKHSSGDPYSQPSTISTDEKGEFLIPDALPSNYNFTLDHGIYHGNTGVAITDGQQEATVELDFTGAILLTGELTLNGRPWPQGEHPFLFPDGPPARGVIGFRNRPGIYSAWLYPGDYNLSVWRHPQGQVRLASVTVTPQPMDQVHDFHLSQATGYIALVFPRDEDFEAGSIAFSREGGGEGPSGALSTIQINSDAQRVTGIPIDRIRATFRSASGKWQGMSDWVDVSTEEDNIFIINLDTKDPIRIGSWHKEVLSPVYQDLTFDITPHLARGGTWEVIFDYESGDEGLMIESVGLYGDGALLSIDRHPGWSGYSRRDHIYSLDAPEPIPGARYTISASVRAGSNQNSQGTVWLQER